MNDRAGGMVVVVLTGSCAARLMVVEKLTRKRATPTQQLLLSLFNYEPNHACITAAMVNIVTSRTRVAGFPVRSMIFACTLSCHMDENCFNTIIEMQQE
jgi:hypothetical protein